MTDTKAPALTALSAPALDDVLYAVDVSDTTDDASGSSRSVTVERLLAMGLHSVCQGRLTTESGVGVSTSDRTSQGTLYFTPWNGNRIALYDGTRWGFYAFTERSLALSGLTSGKNYDVFLYNNAGTLTLELSAAWSNDTTRTDTLTTQDGISVKSGAATRRLLGTIRTTGTTTTEDSLTKRFVWNLYNQVTRTLQVQESTSFWSYASTTIRPANNSTANRVEWVNGITTNIHAQTVVWVSVVQITNTDVVRAGLGLDSTTVFSGLFTGAYINSTSGSTNVYISLSSRYSGAVVAGYHYLQWLEAGSTTGGCAFVGNYSGTQCGISGEFAC